MEVLNAELVHRLARMKANGKPVVSMFLNVDGRSNIRVEDYVGHLESLIKDAAESPHFSECAGDLDRIRDYVQLFERGSNRGLAIFASGDDMWEAIKIPIPVEDKLILNATPHIKALERILDDYESIGVLLTDRQRARLMVVELGQIVERREVVDPLPRHDDDGGGWRKDHVKAHATATASHHIKRATDEMFELYKERPFLHLVIGGSEDIKGEIERNLHSYLSSKLAGRIGTPLASSDDEILANARELVLQRERANEAMLVDKLRAGVGSNGNGNSRVDNSTAVAGLDSTLKAIFEKRVDTLLVSEGFATEGWRCHSCNLIATLGRSCAMCNAEMTLVDDVVEEAVEDALAQNCHVEFCAENADLDVMGRIGALLRF